MVLRCSPVDTPWTSEPISQHGAPDIDKCPPPAAPLSFRLLTDRIHQITLLFVSVLEPTDQPLEGAERERTIHRVHRWAPHISPEILGIIVDTAHHALRSGMSPDVGVIARELADVLDTSEARQLLADLGRIAQADGHLTPGAALAITEIRGATNRSVPRRRSGPRDSAERSQPESGPAPLSPDSAPSPSPRPPTRRPQ